MGVCNCSMFCCTFLYVPSSFAIILTGMRELFALLNLSSWCLVIVVWLFFAVPRVCLQFVIVVFPDHAHSLFRMCSLQSSVVWSLFSIYGIARLFNLWHNRKIYNNDKYI